jgi:hypothetical protein
MYKNCLCHFNLRDHGTFDRVTIVSIRNDPAHTVIGIHTLKAIANGFGISMLWIDLFVQNRFAALDF